MKKPITKAIVGMVTILSLFLACSEADSAIMQLLWSGSCFLMCGISAMVYKKYFMTEEEKEEQV